MYNLGLRKEDPPPENNPSYDVFIFHYHPALASLAFFFIGLSLLIKYGLFPSVDRRLYHGVFMMIALILMCAVVGISYHDVEEKGFQHFDTLHTWVAIFTFALFAAIVIPTMIAFFFAPQVQAILARLSFWTNHMYVGALVYSLVVASIVTGYTIDQSFMPKCPYKGPDDGRDCTNSSWDNMLALLIIPLAHFIIAAKPSIKRKGGAGASASSGSAQGSASPGESGAATESLLPQ